MVGSSSDFAILVVKQRQLTSVLSSLSDRELLRRLSQFCLRV